MPHQAPIGQRRCRWGGGSAARAASCWLLGAASTFLLGTAALRAAEVLDIAVSFQGERYHVTFEVLLNAPADRVWRHLVDYENLDRLSDTVVESRVLTSSEGKRRVQIAMRPCVFIFCRTIRRTVDVEIFERGHILSLADPRKSDFVYSEERWEIKADGQRTRLSYDAVAEPRFFVAPVIGPWLIRRVITHELRTTAIRLEALANE